MEEPDSILTWLKRLLLVLGAALMGLLCVLLWQLSVLVADIDRSVSDMAADMKQVTATAAAFSVRFDELGARLDRFEEAATALLDKDRLTSVEESAETVLQSAMSPKPNLDTGAQAEINYLLETIGQPTVRYEYRGKQRPPLWVRWKLEAVFRLYKNVITTAEDFIAKVATKTMDGYIYYVVDENGAKTELGSWLREALAKYRSIPAGAEQ
jgi:hypothetical protein